MSLELCTPLLYFYRCDACWSQVTTQADWFGRRYSCPCSLQPYIHIWKRAARTADGDKGSALSMYSTQRKELQGGRKERECEPSAHRRDKCAGSRARPRKCGAGRAAQGGLFFAGRPVVLIPGQPANARGGIDGSSSHSIKKAGPIRTGREAKKKQTSPSTPHPHSSAGGRAPPAAQKFQSPIAHQPSSPRFCLLTLVHIFSSSFGAYTLGGPAVIRSR